MKKLIVLLFIFSFHYAYAISTGDLKGEIFSAENEKPVDNCVIRVIELKKSALTGANGEFKIKDIPRGEYIIEFSRIGYRTERRKAKIIEDSTYTISFKLIPIGVTSSEVVVSAERPVSKFMEITDHAANIQGKELTRKLGATIASSLQNEAGVSSRSMGPAPARPVIRGLSGARVIMTEDRIPTSDMSATSPDHAVGIEPFSGEKIEIIRGPQTLEFTTNSIGGVVNVVQNTVPLNKIQNYFFESSGYYESANNGGLGAFDFGVPISDFEINGKYSYRKAGDLHAAGKTLLNSSLETQNYSMGLGYSLNDDKMGLGIKEFSTSYGIPGGFVGSHPKGVTIDMLKRTAQAQSFIHLHNSLVDNSEINFARTYFKQTEFESNGSVGSEFVVTDYFASLKFNGYKNDVIEENSLGLNLNYKIFEPGGYVFTPKTNSISISPYYFVDFTLGNHYLQAGVRYSYDKYVPDRIDKNSKIGVIEEKSFNSLGASISIMNKISESIYAGVNLSLTSRAPALEELFSQGPHLAAYSFEVGNPNLKEEYGFGGELFTYFKSADLNASLVFFINELPYFITTRNTGKINYQQLLPIYAYSGVRARLLGFESKTEYNFNKEFEFSFTTGYTLGLNLDEKTYLPSMPPLKGLIEIKYNNNEFNCGVSQELALAQNNVDKFETPTAGYISFGAYAQYLLVIKEKAVSFSLSVDNIFNTDKRNHLSRIKSILPEPGRNIRLITKIML